MEAVVQTITQEVMNHHLTAFGDADVEEILKDYSEDSELLTPDGAIKGLDGIRSFFEGAFKLIPKGSPLELKQFIVRDELIYITWTGDSSAVSIPFGCDTFLFEGDKIKCQAIGMHLIMK